MFQINLALDILRSWENNESHSNLRHIHSISMIHGLFDEQLQFAQLEEARVHCEPCDDHREECNVLGG